jgi:hypothetical protein
MDRGMAYLTAAVAVAADPLPLDEPKRLENSEINPPPLPYTFASVRPMVPAKLPLLDATGASVTGAGCV